MIDKIEAKEVFEEFDCTCDGVIAPNAICGYVRVNTNDCGAPTETECEWRQPKLQ